MQNIFYVATAEVLLEKQKVGMLSKIVTENKEIYVFAYDQAYCENKDAKPLVPLMPKILQPYYSDILFPVFFSLLSEGNAKKFQCQIHKIDQNNYFQLLLKTCVHNTMSGIKIREITKKAYKNKPKNEMS
ncbi:MAG: phosphatidylinositol kinase [Bacteroidetes bacterium]|nr:MAG: phosphatidylinositol kinase [Bacteroidota bacterium]